MQKNNVIKAVCLNAMISIMLTSCDIPEVTTSFDNNEYQTTNDNNNEYESGNDIDTTKNVKIENDNTIKNNEITDNIDATHYEIRYIPKDKTIYHIGDMVSPIGAIESDIGIYVHFKIKSAKVYEHVSDAKLDDSKISDEWVLFDGESGYKAMAYKNEETMESRFLLCDIDMEYEESYLEWIDFDNITKISLIYVQEDGRYVMTGYPIYLSNRDSSKPVYRQNDYDIQEGTINLQVGWVIDKALFEVDEFDLSKLYICTAHDGNQKFQEFVYLGLKENED